MKNLITATLLLVCFFSKAQVVEDGSSRKLNKIITWYESPKESHGDTVVFRTKKYLLGAGDDPAYAFSNITFKDATYFTVEYWRWSTKAAAANFGTWSNTNPTTILLDFGHQKSKCNLSILETTNDKLKVIIKEQ